ncbi:hypothetical protein [Melittangium boletus]|uniref:hypothetical protein n=1 Tax=Melittangium boletus TaxID=83453 RepID=UPI003DA6878F
MLLGLVCGLWSCSAPNPNVRVERMQNGVLRVKGPLAGPFTTREELAARACDIMTGQPGAANGAYGFEYCALHYYSHESKGFFLSYLSDIGGGKDGGRKFCQMPLSVDDESHPDAIILGGAHSHPHNRQFSREDLSARAQWRPTRVFDQHSRRVFDRELLMLYREKTGECRAYGYNSATRIVSALREGQWIPIGTVYSDDGDIRLMSGQDWLP